MREDCAYHFCKTGASVEVTASGLNPARRIAMRPSLGARALSTAGLLCLGYLQNANGAPIPHTEKQTPAAQVMLAPAQISAGQPPPKEPLPADARKPDRILRAGHKGSVQALAFSPDRKWLASGGDDK